MISVNQKFKDSCNSANVQSQFKLFLSTVRGGTAIATLNDDEFIIDSGSIEKQASSGAVLNIGGVCSNRVKITLTQKGVEKVNAVNGFKKNYCLHLVQWNKVDDANQSPSDFSENLDHTENETGKCNLGYYYISEIDNNYYNCVITAYDGMIAFQRNFTITQIKYLRKHKKTVDQWLDYLCSLVYNDINLFYTDNAAVTCNDGVTFSLSDDSDFDTMRECISQLAMLKMAYATIDEYGNLTLKPAINTTGLFDDTVANQYMFSCDNEVTESVIKYFYTSVAGFEYENNYTDQQGRNKISIYLEENKFLRGFEPYNGKAMSSSSLTCLRNMAQAVMGYSFYSCECEINERPYIELGDNVQIQRRLVDTQGTVTQISIPVVVDNLSHNMGSTTNLSSNSTVSNTTSSSGKMNLNKSDSNVNSKTKEPSTKDVIDSQSSPVQNYTDTTATVRVRIDDSKIENMRLPSGATEYSRTVKEYTDSSYYFSTGLNLRDLQNLTLKLHKRISIQSLKSLVGLTFNVTSPGTELTSQSYPPGYWYDGTFKITAININPVTPTQSVMAEVGAGVRRNAYYNSGGQEYTFIGNDTYFHRDLDILDDFITNNTGHNLSVSGLVEEENLSVIMPTDRDSMLRDLRALNGYTVYNLPTSSDTVFKKLQAIGESIISNIEIVCEVNYNTEGYAWDIGTNHYPDDIMSVLDIPNKMLSLAEIYLHYEEANRMGLTSEAAKAAQVINTVYNNYTFSLDRYYVECTYLTASAPISEGDKIKVDDKVVTTEDFEDLSGQVNANTQAISDLRDHVNEVATSLGTDIDNVNADLQSTKGDINSLDNRVDLLEDSKAEANPSDAATATLTKLKVGAVTYEVPSGGGGGGTTVVANPSGQASADLAKLQVGSIIYGIPTGTEVEANPSGQGTANLSKLKVGSTIYNIPSGGGSSPIIVPSTLAERCWLYLTNNSNGLGSITYDANSLTSSYLFDVEQYRGREFDLWFYANEGYKIDRERVMFFPSGINFTGTNENVSGSWVLESLNQDLYGAFKYYASNDFTNYAGNSRTLLAKAANFLSGIIPSNAKYLAVYPKASVSSLTEYTTDYNCRLRILD